MKKSIGFLAAVLFTATTVFATNTNAEKSAFEIDTKASKVYWKGKKVTGFTNTEEEAVGLTRVVPFLVEDMLVANGGHYSKLEDWKPYVVVDGLLITGQNPASSEPAAQALLKKLT